MSKNLVYKVIICLMLAVGVIGVIVLYGPDRASSDYPVKVYVYAGGGPDGKTPIAIYSCINYSNVNIGNSWGSRYCKIDGIAEIQGAIVIIEADAGRK